MRSRHWPVWLAGAGLAACAGAPAPLTFPPTLAGSRWQLEALTSMDDAQPEQRPADGARYTLTFGADGVALLQLDCNRGRASWQAEPAPDATPQRRSGALRFGDLASTRAMCAPDSLAPRLAAQLPHVRSYVIERGRLHLALMADGGLLRWAPLPPAP